MAEDTNPETNPDVIEVFDKSEKDGGGQMVIFVCPGCGSNHGLTIGGSGSGAKWSWNGSKTKPTLSPSILARLLWSQTHPGKLDEVCHSYVTNGQIQFLSDCTHEFKNQTIQLLPVIK